LSFLVLGTPLPWFWTGIRGGKVPHPAPLEGEGAQASQVGCCTSS